MIRSIDPDPIAELRYLNARSGGGTEVSRLEVLRAHTDRLADELDAIAITSDLQGMSNGALLGVAVADLLVDLAERGVLPRVARTGIVLAGDLYSVPAANKRGGFGDVSTVWQAFSVYPWVVGVAGNHDDVGAVPELGEHLHLLDGTTVVVDGIRFGGVGGIIGNPRKPGRRDEDDQLARISAVLDEGCDILVLHEGPHGDEGQPGNAAIRELVDAAELPFVACGHAHWEHTLGVRAAGQTLNVDARVVVLCAG